MQEQVEKHGGGVVFEMVHEEEDPEEGESLEGIDNVPRWQNLGPH